MFSELDTDAWRWVARTPSEAAFLWEADFCPSHLRLQTRDHAFLYSVNKCIRVPTVCSRGPPSGRLRCSTADSREASDNIYLQRHVRLLALTLPHHMWEPPAVMMMIIFLPREVFGMV